MDTSWITLPNDHPDYINGCREFIEFAKHSLVEGKTKCPCKNCKLRYYFTLGEIEGHILFKGFYQKYTDWFWHGKRDVLDHLHGESRKETLVGRDDMKGLLNVVYGTNIPNHSNDLDDDNPFAGSVEIEKEPEFDDVSMGFSSSGESDNEFEHAYDARTDDYSNKPHNLNDKEDANYKRLLEASDEALYEGCQSFSKLSFLLHLYHIKCMFHWSNESFNKLLELVLQAFPQIREFPSTFYEGKKIINDLGLGYEKIHACPFNCMLFWGDNNDKEECNSCHTSRWKKVRGEKGKSLVKKGEGAKVMRYFPLIPRLKRVYASSKTAEDMRWHHKDRVKDGKLRHPADALAWEQFDSRYPLFASDPRSVRLALATDGFNPYRLMNTTYSTWPVILIPYNLPPWLCMKPSSFLLSCIIPGKSSPGIDIDVYLQPLISELKLLWSGVDAFDAFDGETFKLRAALHSTHKRKDGSYVKDTATEEFVLDADTYVEFELATNPTKPKVQIQNEAFNKLMYGEDIPKRPLGYGFGVKGSDVIGVHGILRKETREKGDSSSLALQNMKNMEKLIKDKEELQSKLNETNIIVYKILEGMSSGMSSLEIAQLKSTLNSQISDSTNGGDASR